MMDVETFGRKRKRNSSLEVSDDHPPAPPLGTVRAEPVDPTDRQSHADGIVHRVVRQEQPPSTTDTPNSEPQPDTSSSSSSSDSSSSTDEAVEQPEQPTAEPVIPTTSGIPPGRFDTADRRQRTRPQSFPSREVLRHSQAIRTILQLSTRTSDRDYQPSPNVTVLPTTLLSH